MPDGPVASESLRTKHGIRASSLDINYVYRRGRYFVKEREKTQEKKDGIYIYIYIYIYTVFIKITNSFCSATGLMLRNLNQNQAKYSPFRRQCWTEFCYITSLRRY